MTNLEPNPLAQAAQKEAATRPVIGGTEDDARQQKLNEEIGLSADVIQANADLAAGIITMEEYNQRTGVNR